MVVLSIAKPVYIVRLYLVSLHPLMHLLVSSVIALLSATGGCQENAPSGEDWLGKFAMVQTCDGATNPGYTLEVKPVTNEPARLYLNNLGGYGQRVAATVQGDSITIVPTEVNVGLMGQVQLSGTGARRTGFRRTGARHDDELFIQLNVQVPGPQGTTTMSQCELRGTRIDT